ncbi:helical backbone metal receptor [Allokutzneria sp. A3M-2-11 16]|uniref:helical backbone metal receptor n=1 Tax=Allokutzneria sp. A3M-2-11 16 TaxID=2962043 RepID=UPI0020B8108C|nr:helical backbone metal receptor [Allokutzneria sp. A3M-2-11 16]MCP3801174.1 helical backbone metal receptor [Allokutzneria sp. A3M-2-11 16]
MKDDLGALVELRERPRRVVSLVPSLTEVLAADTRDALVGVTDYCTHPADLDLPRIGGSKYPKVSEVLAVSPDLVVANSEENRPEEVAALREAGVPVWVTEAPATVPAALASIRRLLGEAFDLAEPEWLREAERLWNRELPPVTATAVVPVWRKPWIVVGRDTFAGDVLRRLGVANAYAEHEERYPRPKLDELQAVDADLVVLPDEPYEFTADDGPEAFPGTRSVLVNGRFLTWYGPSLVAAHAELAAALSPRPTDQA